MKNEKGLKAGMKQALSVMRKLLSPKEQNDVSEEIIVCTKYLSTRYPMQTSFFKQIQKASRQITARHAYKDFQVLRC